MLDNASIHKTSRVREAAVARGFRIEYLPPYSPELNPIELVFGTLKPAYYRHRLSESFKGIRDSVETLISAKATPSLVRNCFRHVVGVAKAIVTA